MLRVGLTGSIAVGKSFVSSVFSELGCHVLDADQTARDVVGPGSPGLTSVVEEFGTEVLQPDGTLNRPRLAALIFETPEKRLKLNAILHPFIIDRQDEILREWERSDPAGIGIVDAALMIESGGYSRFDKLVIVHCRPEIQLERLMLHRNLSRLEAESRINSQMPQQEKLAFADYSIDTSDGFEPARLRTLEVFDELKRFALDLNAHSPR